MKKIVDKNGVEITKGSRVQVRKGVAFTSTDPKTASGSVFERGRTFTVSGLDHTEDADPIPAQVVWSGIGGHRFSCAAHDTFVVATVDAPAPSDMDLRTRLEEEHKLAGHPEADRVWRDTIELVAYNISRTYAKVADGLGQPSSPIPVSVTETAVATSA
jgi:hypothetical protein